MIRNSRSFISPRRVFLSLGKRHGQILSQEADLCHQRKLRSEAGSRELRRKRMALERSYGLQACYEESASERAVQTQSLELQEGARQLEQLRAELVRKRRQLSERRSLVEERRLRGEQLSEDLAAERRRSDEMQRDSEESF